MSRPTFREFYNKRLNGKKLASMGEVIDNFIAYVDEVVYPPEPTTADEYNCVELGPDGIISGPTALETPHPDGKP